MFLWSLLKQRPRKVGGTRPMVQHNPFCCVLGVSIKRFVPFIKIEMVGWLVLNLLPNLDRDEKAIAFSYQDNRCYSTGQRIPVAGISEHAFANHTGRCVEKGSCSRAAKEPNAPATWSVLDALFIPAASTKRTATTPLIRGRSAPTGNKTCR